MSAEPRPPQDGFTLLSILAAMVILAFGLLVLAKAYVGVTLAGTQNGIVSELAQQGNGFWGVIQANPVLLAPGSGLAGTFTSANIDTAPAPVQPWLTALLSTQANPSALPQGSVSITTGPDSASGNACSSAGCSVSMVIRWNQTVRGNVPEPGAQTRSQAFSFQFGL